MTYKTHVQGSVIASSLYLYLLDNINNYNCKQLLAFYIISSFSSKLPDLDNPNSISANEIYLLDDLIRKLPFIKHRGIFHFNISKDGNFIVAVIRYTIIFFLIKYSLNSDFIIKSLILGYSSHIILDYITSYVNIKTGKDIENKFVINILGYIALISIAFIIYCELSNIINKTILNF